MKSYPCYKCDKKLLAGFITADGVVVCTDCSKGRFEVSFKRGSWELDFLSLLRAICVVALVALAIWWARMKGYG